jgi:ABC-type antimicrobial peptide transport system permease subunit
VRGGVVACPSGRWIGPFLFRQSPLDLTVFALVGGVLLGVAVVASCIPALRAARVDPRTALQAD